jgi:hypothetical protein
MGAGFLFIGFMSRFKDAFVNQKDLKSKIKMQNL